MAEIMKLGPLAAQIDLNDWTKHAAGYQGFQHQLDYKHESIVMPRLRRSKPLPSGVGERTIILNLWVRGSNKANLAANWREISAQLELCRRYMELGDGAPVYLEYRPDGASASVLFEVLAGNLPPFPGGGQIHGEWIQDGQLTLYCNPYARGVTATTDTSGTLNYDSAFLKTAVLDSDCPTPARVRVQNKTASSEYDYMVVATRSRGNVDNFIEQYRVDLNATLPPPTYGTASYMGTPGLRASRYARLVATFRAKVASGAGRVQFFYRSTVYGAVDYLIGQEFVITNTSFADFTLSMPVNPATGVNWIALDLYFSASPTGYFGFRKVGTVEVKISKLTITQVTVDRDFAEVSTVLDPTAVGTVSDWAITGAATAWQALADASDATYIASSTDGQRTNVFAFPLLPATGAVRASFYPSLIRNWDLEDTPNAYTSESPIASTTIGFESGFTYSGLVAPNGFDVGVAVELYSGNLAGNGVDVTTGTHAGGHAQGLLGTGFGAFLGISLAMEIGVRYRFSVWMKVDNVANGLFSTVRVLDGATPIADHHNPDVPRETNYQSTSWQEVTFDFTAISSTLLVQFAVPNVPAAYEDMAVFDDLSLTELSATPDGWILNGNISGRKVDAITHGTSAFRVGVGDSTTNYFSQTISVQNAMTFRLRAGLTEGAVVRLESGANSVEMVAGDTEKAFTAGATSLTVKLFGRGSAGTIDAIRLITTPYLDTLAFTILTGLEDQYGLYRAIGRVRVSGSTVQLRTVYGGYLNGIHNPLVEVQPTTGVQLVDLGIIRIPTVEPPSGVIPSGFQWFVFLEQAALDEMDTSTTIDFDSVHLMPIDENYWEIEQVSGSGPIQNQYAVTDTQPVRDPIDYVLDSNGTSFLYAVNHVGGHLSFPKQANKVIVLVARSRVDHRRGDSYVVDVQRYPRYEGWVG